MLVGAQKPFLAHSAGLTSSSNVDRAHVLPSRCFAALSCVETVMEVGESLSSRHQRDSPVDRHQKPFSLKPRRSRFSAIKHSCFNERESSLAPQY